MKDWATERRFLLPWRGRLAVVCAALVSLSACQPPASQMPENGIGRRMRDLATRYVHDKEAGMAGIIEDIQNCYALASQPPIIRSNVRDCLVLDTVAFYDESVFDQTFGARGLPYFEPSARTARWSYYGPLANFDDVGQQVHYMAERAALVQMDIQKISSDSIMIRG